ncbi:MAG: hypothetical protein NTX50_22525 [Candidatus Sumerlaeota bacterium]|nr:hypothetical protein [Candidatus Sumerlaeota bacterium]
MGKTAMLVTAIWIAIHMCYSSKAWAAEAMTKEDLIAGIEFSRGRLVNWKVHFKQHEEWFAGTKRTEPDRIFTAILSGEKFRYSVDFLLPSGDIYESRIRTWNGTKFNSLFTEIGALAPYDGMIASTPRDIAILNVLGLFAAGGWMPDFPYEAWKARGPTRDWATDILELLKFQGKQTDRGFMKADITIKPADFQGHRVQHIESWIVWLDGEKILNRAKGPSAFIDPKRSFVTLQYDLYNVVESHGDVLIRKYESAIKEVTSGIWLPCQIVATHYVSEDYADRKLSAESIGAPCYKCSRTEIQWEVNQQYADTEFQVAFPDMAPIFDLDSGKNIRAGFSKKDAYDLQIGLKTALSDLSRVSQPGKAAYVSPVDTPNQAPSQRRIAQPAGSGAQIAARSNHWAWIVVVSALLVSLCLIWFLLQIMLKKRG